MMAIAIADETQTQVAVAGCKLCFEDPEFRKLTVPSLVFVYLRMVIWRLY